MDVNGTSDGTGTGFGPGTDRVRDALRAAVAAGPAPAVDLDALIGAERHRSHSLRMMTVLAGAAASVLLVTGVIVGVSARGPAGYRPATGHGPGLSPAPGAKNVPGVSPRGTRPCPTWPVTGAPRAYQSGVPSPKAVPESCGDTTARLDAALADALRAYAPGVTFGAPAVAGMPSGFARANDDNLEYDAGLNLFTAAGRGGLAVTIVQRTAGPLTEAESRRSWNCDGAQPQARCEYHTFPDGAVAVGQQLLPGAERVFGPGEQLAITVYRPDATVVSVWVSNTYYEGTPDPQATPLVGAPHVPLTVDQLIAIGRYPGLTLYP